MSDPRPEEMPVGQCTNTGPGLSPVVEKCGSRCCGSADFPNCVSILLLLANGRSRPPQAAPSPLSCLRYGYLPGERNRHGLAHCALGSGAHREERVTGWLPIQLLQIAIGQLSISLSPVHCTSAIVTFAAISLSLLMITLPPYNFLIRS